MKPTQFLPWTFGIGLFVVLVGCAPEDDPTCQLGDGRTGVCCSFESGANALDGACIDGLCTNGEQSGASIACGNAPPGGAADARPGFPDTFMPIGGSGGGDASTTDAGSGGDGGAGGAGGAEDGGRMGGAGGIGGSDFEPCTGVVCEPDERCDPTTGSCVGEGRGMVAGPCEVGDLCAMGGMCLDEEENDLPGGFCFVECQQDLDCGGGLACPAEVCLNRCSDGQPCRNGWTCAELEDETSVCLPDCRVAGCGVDEFCNDDTGLCDLVCPYACDGGETCVGGHCVRDDGTCVTDYHCPVGTQQCFNGRCSVAEFTECGGARLACDQSQTCVPTGEDTGLCLFSCQTDNDCPVDKACFADLGDVCYFAFCGPAQAMGAPANGEVYGACDAGSGGQWPGTCLPIVRGNPADPNDFGLCVEAGTAQIDEPCDSQTNDRDVSARELQCAGGLLCFDDNDDSLDPGQNWGERGQCVDLCDPRVAGNCTVDHTCVDFSALDDAATIDFDESRFLGLCLEDECTVLDNNCAEGEGCQTWSFLSNSGHCESLGDTAAGQPCESPDDCADHAICANAGDGDICLVICDPAAPGCDEEQECFNQDGWAYGVCL